MTTEIAIFKGPGKSLRFEPITLFVKSSCMSDGHDPAFATADAWNREVEGVPSLVYTAPCPAIRWADRLAEHRQFVFAGNTLSELDSLVEVSIFNEVCCGRIILFTFTFHSHCL